VRLREWDFDKQNYVEVNYPDAPIIQFVNFFRTTKAWIHDADRVNRQVLKLDKALGEHRQLAREAMAQTAANVTGQPLPKPTLEDYIAAARSPEAPEMLQMLAAEISRLRALEIGAAPKKGGRRAAHATE